MCDDVGDPLSHTDLGFERAEHRAPDRHVGRAVRRHWSAAAGNDCSHALCRKRPAIALSQARQIGRFHGEGTRNGAITLPRLSVARRAVKLE